MHEFDEEIDALAAKILEYSLVRLKKDPPLDGPWTYEELYAEVGETITESGIGGEKALDLFKHVLAQACISTDHPWHLFLQLRLNLQTYLTSLSAHLRSMAVHG
ncbi:MAG: hypothetical protein RL155_1000 [Actinomycetota bacterium]